MKANRRRGGPCIELPVHWTPEQALAVFEALHAVRHALWLGYPSQVQQAWLEQLGPPSEPPDFDPNDPF
jgi:hypothetical protein